MSALPAAFLKELEPLLGPELPSFLEAFERPAQVAFRLNPLKPQAQAAVARSGMAEEAVPWAPLGRYAAAGVRPGAHPLHAAGGYYVQDASAMAPAQVLSAQPGEWILDLCAAPGGKAGQLAGQLMGQGLLVANEPDAKRARALSGNLERLGVVNAQVVSALPHDLAQRWPEAFDGVLVDAPCSGEGMFRRDPEALTQWNPAAPAGCAARQAQILDQAALMVRPGGRLVYSTCTFNALENEETVRLFLARHPEFERRPFSLEGVGEVPEGTLRLWPHRVRGEGHFVALLARSGAPGRRTEPPVARPARQVTEALDRLIPDVLPQLPPQLAGYELALAGDHLVARPPQLPDARGLRLLRQGLTLLRVGRGYIEPDHALAMVLSPNESTQWAALTEEEALRALRGEALPQAGPPGWVVLGYEGLPLGWAKRSDGVLKNHIPKGLRWRAG